MLLRFRCQLCAWVSDTEKAFLMVSLDDKDSDVTALLWPTDTMDVTSPFVIYQFTAVLLTVLPFESYSPKTRINNIR